MRSPLNAVVRSPTYQAPPPTSSRPGSCTVVHRLKECLGVLETGWPTSAGVFELTTSLSMNV